MRTIGIILISLIVLCLAACEPFALSVFPGYLSDTVAFCDLRPYFTQSEIESYAFFTENNQDTGSYEEYVFVLANRYSGNPVLVVLDSNLNFITRRDDEPFWERHLFDVSDSYIVGNVGTTAPDFSSSSTGPSASPRYGCAIWNAGNMTNALFQMSGDTLDIDLFTSGWAANGTKSILVDGTSTDNYKICGVDRVIDVTFPSLALTSRATVLIIKSNDEEGERGYAILFVNDSIGSFPLETYYGNLGGNLLAGPHINLGPIDGEAFATNDGVVAKGLDGTIRLFGWDGRVKAQSRPYQDEKVIADYGNNGYYYVFDPSSCRLFKASYWWK